jgi:hypothetical protein
MITKNAAVTLIPREKKKGRKKKYSSLPHVNEDMYYYSNSFTAGGKMTHLLNV